MKKTLIVFFFVLCCLFLFGESLYVVTEDYPPYNYLKNGVPAGVSVEIVQAVFKEAGIKADINFVPWARGYDMTLKGINANAQSSPIMIFSMVRLPVRETFFQWVGPIVPYNVYLFSLATRNDIKISKLDDAKKYRIGTTKNDAKEIFLLSKGFSKDKNLETTANNEKNISKLLNERIDMIMLPDIVTYELLKRESQDKNTVKKVLYIKELSFDGLYIGLSMNTPKELYNKINDAFLKLKKNGTIKKIQDKYF